MRITRHNNEIILVLSKIVYGRKFWRVTNNSETYNTEVSSFPKQKTIFGMTEKEAMLVSDICVYWKQHARYGWDKVTFIAQFCMTNGHTLEFSGERAKSLWKAYNVHVFAKEKHENKRTDNQGDNKSSGEQPEISQQGCATGDTPTSARDNS